ncbi:Deg1p-like type II pseudouridylate synthase [Cryptosporidium xiaoi]|uniref:tRNA pseudouridine synthase n=1 Tax=Cryptosporidium xiaoi TaxID=659607 RepID=A0AAV9XUK4_9CRYT
MRKEREKSELDWSKGVAYQKDDEFPTIEGEIYKSLLQLKLIRDLESCELVRCGRTDRGVHSTGNYISVNLRTRSKDLEPYNYTNMLNRVLPWDIRILGFCQVRNNFSARFDCSYRIYKYFFPLSYYKQRNPKFPFITPEGVDIMNKAAKQFIGTHDYRRFCKIDLKNGKHKTYTRTIYEFEIQIPNQEESKYAIATIKGSAFLWHQVRLMIGILFEIGQSKMNPGVISEMLKNYENKNTGEHFFHMASETGLILWDCVFEEYTIQSIPDSLKTFIEEANDLEFKTSIYKFMGSCTK